MPVYNVERYLAQAIDSILSQTFREFEFIAIDDGSTDGSLKILREYESRDARLRVITRPNTGQTRAMNELIELSAGEFIARMDSDDIAMPDRLQRQVDFLKNNPDIIAVGGGVTWIDQDGDEICAFPTRCTHDEIDAAHLAGVGGAMSQPATMYRKSALLAVGGMREDTHLAEDVDLFLRLAEHGKLMNLEGIVLKWRLHAGSTGGTKAKKQAEIKDRVVREAHQRRGLPIPMQTTEKVDSVERPGDTQRMWAWWALGAKNVGAARKLAWAALRQSPLNRASWMTMLCAVRGY
jgi:glycosyltransferase involved in cell wall biosynthesis